jgi:hypothetical protein
MLGPENEGEDGAEYDELDRSDGADGWGYEEPPQATVERIAAKKNRERVFMSVGV